MQELKRSGCSFHIFLHLGPSRWVSRVKAEEADGYELFGQKIAIPDNDVPATRVRNKFTLEVSNIDIALDGTANPASPGSMMANQYEDSDNVNVDEDLNGESEAEPKMPRAIKSLSPIKTVNKIGSVEDIDDAELTRASGQVESWHRSAVELEGWLEKQVRPFDVFVEDFLIVTYISDLADVRRKRKARSWKRIDVIDVRCILCETEGGCCADCLSYRRYRYRGRI